MIQVVAAMIRDDGRFLICRRPAGKSNALLWEFPGGKVENGETNEDALAREIREELGCEVAVEERLAETTHTYPNVQIHLSFFAARLISGTPECLEHAGMAWISEHELPNYVFCPADQKLIRAVFGR